MRLLPLLPLATAACTVAVAGVSVATTASSHAAEIGTLALAATTVAAIVASDRRRAARLAALQRAADAIVPAEAASGGAPAAGRISALERSLARVAVSMGAREASMRSESAKQQLDAEVQRALAMADTESEVLHIAASALERILPDSPAEVLLADSAQREVHLGAVSRAGAPGCPVDSPARCPAMRGRSTLRVIQSDGLDVCPRLRDRAEAPTCAACVPLSVMGRSIGVIHATPRRELIDDTRVGQLELVATHVGNRLGMLQMIEASQAQAATDPLTGLPNRRSFEERAPASMRGRCCAVAIIDADHFKNLNDTLGHAAGDAALRQLASVMTESLGKHGALVARLGGEEFAAILPDVDGVRSRAIVDALRADLAAAIERSHSPRFTISIGVALRTTEGRTLAELLSAADAALYRAKADGRDRVAIAGTADDALSRDSAEPPARTEPPMRLVSSKPRAA